MPIFIFNLLSVSEIITIGSRQITTHTKAA